MMRTFKRNLDEGDRKLSIISKFFSPILVLAIILLTACANDKEIKADIATKAKTDVNFAGVTYTVKDKIVMLSGTCPSYTAKQKVLQAIRSINVIKGVKEQISITPLILTHDFGLKQRVDSVLGSYAEVTGDVNDGAVTLAGRSTQKEIGKLLPAINKLKPIAVSNRISVIQ